MPKYLIETDVVIGYYCMGAAIIESGHAYLELTDEDLSNIKALVQKTGTYDIEEMNLAEAYPEIFNKLYEAYNDAAVNAAKWHWNTESWEDRNDEEYDIDYNYNFAVKFAESHLGYDPNTSKLESINDKKAYFEKWLDDQIENHRSDELEDLLDSLFHSEPEYAELDEEIQFPEQLFADIEVCKD